MINQVKDNYDNNNSGLEAIDLPEGNHIDFMSDEVLARIDLPALKVLARLHSPRVILPILEKYQNIELLFEEKALASESVVAESDFWEMVSKISILVESDLEQYLESKDYTVRENEDESTLLARVLQEKPTLLTDRLKQLVHEGQDYIGGKFYHVFQGIGLDVDTTKISSIVTGNAFRSVLVLSCRGVQVMKNQNNNLVLTIKRGRTRKTEAVIDNDDKQRYRKDSKIKTDAVIYNFANGTLWVNCLSKNDAKKYADAFGILLGNKNYFQRKQSSEMSVFMNRDFGSLLNSRLSEMPVAIKVDVIAVDITLATGGSFRNTATKAKVRCLSTIFHQLEAVNPINELKSIGLRIYFGTDVKEYADLTIKQGAVKVGTNMDLEIVTVLLSKLEAWKLYVQA